MRVSLICHISFLGSVSLFVTATRKDVCDQCVHKDKCSLFGNMTPHEQQGWVTKYPCSSPHNHGNSRVGGFTANANEGYICCPNGIWDLEKQNSANNTKVNPASGNLDPLISNPKPSHPEDLSVDQGKPKPRVNVLIPRTPQPTLDPGTKTSYFPSLNNSPGNINTYSQCSPLTSFPPDPNTGCCGLEATETDRLTAIPNTIWAQKPYIQNTWKPLKPMLDPSIPLWQNSQSHINRKKRELIKSSTRIAGGTETELYQYPWTVLLKTTFNYGTHKAAFNCGGSLISSRYVLTAGHCVFDPNGTIANVEVHLAEYDKQSFPVDCKMVLGVGQKCIQNLIMYGEDVIRHPLYDDNSLSNDIALIRLRGNVPYTDYIRPICLPPINIDDPEFSNLRLAVAGWGSNGRFISDIKQSTVVNLVPQARCKFFYPALSDTQLCAAGYSGEDTCKGDSGGPLMTVYGGKYFVVGVVSGKRADSPCGTSMPSLYSNVYRYIDWIRSNIRN
ncbi:melanization protease 1 isoform X3 [Bombyx mori]|uniref:Peptidase S1 domain-containing protein n=1 Tax=Bombyx mori TaxID=7091 RepID=A0A8R2C9F2_BOMMO|nr:melanization protease 1 isoform X2 [Bombyx mori]